jgi:hypothetical protein
MAEHQSSTGVIAQIINQLRHLTTESHRLS